MRRRALARIGACAVAALATLAPAGAGSSPEPLPHDLALVLAWGEPRGPASFLSDLERELLTTLGVPACFRSVRSAADGATRADELLLRVTVSRYVDEIDFEFAVSDRASPDLDTDRLRVARAGAAFHVELRAVAEDALVRARSFRHVRTWRPRSREDPSEAARLQLIDGAARAIRKLACKGSLASRSRQLERARASRSR